MRKVENISVAEYLAFIDVFLKQQNEVESKDAVYKEQRLDSYDFKDGVVHITTSVPDLSSKYNGEGYDFSSKPNVVTRREINNFSFKISENGNYFVTWNKQRTHRKIENISDMFIDFIENPQKRSEAQPTSENNMLLKCLGFIEKTHGEAVLDSIVVKNGAIDINRSVIINNNNRELTPNAVVPKHKSHYSVAYKDGQFSFNCSSNKSRGFENLNEEFNTFMGVTPEMENDGM